jgi:hypothetical protein
MKITIDFNTDFDEKICEEEYPGDQDKFLEVKKVFDNEIEKIIDICPTYSKDDLKYGSNFTNSEIYDVYPDYYVKKSKLYEIAKLQISQTGKFVCTNGVKQMKFALEEIDSLIQYYQLRSIYPQHIMNIRNLNKCFDGIGEAKEYYTYYEIEKVNGITFDKYLESIDKKKDNELFLILLQLIYVLIYANYNNYYHNDIKLDNIMIYNISEEYQIYDQMHTIIMNFSSNKLFKLIDYSNSVKTEKTNLIYLIDIYLLLKIINQKIKDSELINSKNLINLVLESIQSYGNISESFYYDFSDKKYKLLDKQGIRENGIIVSYKDIKNLFKKIKFLKIQLNDLPNYNIRIKRQIGVYKQKYLNLKNKINLL